VICVALSMLAACASQQQPDGLSVAEVIRDYIEVRQLAEQNKIRTSSADSWRELDGQFIIYETRREVFLIQFARRCHELNETPVVADMRRDAGWVRARFDTIRGCLISKIFTLTENDVAELESLNEPPGGRAESP